MLKQTIKNLNVFNNIEVSNSGILLNKYVDSINVIYLK